jgi:hypothetical protein
MTVCVQVATTRARATYSGPQSAADFLPGDFNTTPSGRTSTAYVQIAPDQVRIHFSGTIAIGDENHYTGAAPGVLTPQTITIT